MTGGVVAGATANLLGLHRAGLLLGFMAGVGVLLTYRGLPRHRRITLTDRLDPYLRDAPHPSRLLTAPRGLQARRRGPVAVVLDPVIRDLAGRVERLLGGASSVRSRLERAGRTPDVDRFRAEQVIWGAVGAGIGGTLGVLILLARGGNIIAFALTVLCATVAGLVAKDGWLTRTARQREQRMLAEFPTIAELLALSVSAGEGAIGALERVCRLSAGELATELGRCLADARAGASLPTALQGLADRTGLPSLARFVDGIVIAVERGTPLAEVLRAQAQDVREEGRRRVLEEGGRREIAMMIPVVFLVLPVTVLFAVYPGFAFLDIRM